MNKVRAIFIMTDGHGRKHGHVNHGLIIKGKGCGRIGDNIKNNFIHKKIDTLNIFVFSKMVSNIGGSLFEIKPSTPNIGFLFILKIRPVFLTR